MKKINKCLDEIKSNGLGIKKEKKTAGAYDLNIINTMSRKSEYVYSYKAVPGPNLGLVSSFLTLGKSVNIISLFFP